MTISEAKAEYPNSKPYQFEPMLGIAVGDRVSFFHIEGGYTEEEDGTTKFYQEKKRMEGTVAKFWMIGGDKLHSVKNGTPPNYDSAAARIHMDNGDRCWKMLNDISKIKITTPETATSGEGQTTTQT